MEALKASSFHHMAKPEVSSTVWKMIWNCRTLPKIRAFLWHSCGNVVASADCLSSRNIPIDPLCSRCGKEKDSVDHIMLHCPYAKAIWFGSSLSHRISNNPSLLIHEWLQHWQNLALQDKNAARESFSKCSFLCWHIWLVRKDFVFSKKFKSLEEIIRSAEAAF
ncbi:uncharacterized protein LOC122639071 [Telopea speciosissima]|uniref:uncharacterized protein LOC122639071 n=1 Tax=Telopea speciosissima TaxID=54955 RepID=UPI001CC829EE|nr:uncharacterized protein LOC122639071 [Telopea speciosissima]